VGLLKKLLGHDGEKFSRMGGPVGIDRGFGSLVHLRPQVEIRFPHNLGPLLRSDSFATPKAYRAATGPIGDRSSKR